MKKILHLIWWKQGKGPPSLGRGHGLFLSLEITDLIDSFFSPPKWVDCRIFVQLMCGVYRHDDKYVDICVTINRTMTRM